MDPLFSVWGGHTLTSATCVVCFLLDPYQGWLWICVGVQCAGHQQWVGVQVCDVFCVLAAMVLPLTYFWRPSMWMFTVELGDERCGRLVGAVWLAAQRLTLTCGVCVFRADLSPVLSPLSPLHFAHLHP